MSSPAGTAAGRPLGSRYVIVEPIGVGATGCVWRGSERDGAAVAVKVLHPELAGRSDVVARFLRERTILTGIDHPNVVRVHDLVVEGDTVAVVLDLVEGGDVRRLLGASPGGTLEPAVAAAVVADVLAGLAAVHRAGVVHCDVKPENVLLAGEGRALLTDAGVATLAHGPEEDGGSSVVGSPEYLAPEVVAGRRPAPASDLYAAGVLLYELLFGRTPFAGGHPAAVLWRHQAVPPPRPPAVPDDVWSLLASLLAKDPAGRPADADAARARLDAVLPVLNRLPPFPPAPDVDFAAALDATRLAPGPAGAPAAGPPAARGRRTRPARGRRAPEGAAHAPAPDPGPAPARDRRAPRASRRRERAVRRAEAPPRRWWIGALVAAAAVGLAGVAALLVVVPAEEAGVPVATFAGVPARHADGLVVTRRFERSGDGGRHVQVTVTLVNDGSERIDAVFEEVLPPSLAGAGVTFHPAPDRRARAGVAGYRVDLGPGERRELAYEADLAGAGPPARLADVAAAQAEAEQERRVAAGLAPPATLHRLELQPPSLTLAPREAFRLGLAGVMSDGTPAPAAALAGVRLAAGPAGVADLRGTTLIAVGTGAGSVIAQAGPLTATARVEVARKGATTQTTGPPAGAPAACGPGDHRWALLTDQAYADAAATAPADLGSLAPGQVVWVVLHARNTGPQPWCRDGGAAVRLATEDPPDHPSGLATPEWPSASQAAALREERTEPDGVGSFAFPIGAPDTPGPFRERFTLVVEGVGRMEDIGYAVEGAVVSPPAPAPAP